jgi:hypothetical protein
MEAMRRSGAMGAADRAREAMSRYAFVVFLLLGHIAAVGALAAVVLTSDARKSRVRGDFCQSQGAVPLPQSELGSSGASGAPAPAPVSPVLPRDNDSPDAAPIAAELPMSDDSDASDAAAPPGATVLPPNDRVAALEQLVAQSRQENEQLAQIGDHIAAQRQQMADDELRRRTDAESRAATHAATVVALDSLRQVVAQITTGNSDGVDEKLAGAETALSGRTRLDVDAAREALARGDLFETGLEVTAALGERRALR